MAKLMHGAVCRGATGRRMMKEEGDVATYRAGDIRQATATASHVAGWTLAATGDVSAICRDEAAARCLITPGGLSGTRGWSTR